ncbi:hypothetical protein [Corynebacterium freneyi]|uniref:Uncharacterized protein n=1 Tax=Corynebacterium freneyi TaxID=134034 RepID=A0ABS4UA88_9CORY|nr:hypothetical protein [Corynebacterium freneyi]MBP2333462.1 hypothetical protein [Corynebacterium freneyi]QXA52498.1 hypothetical protein I6L56_10675 [Corynebacterium freneyi]
MARTAKASSPAWQRARVPIQPRSSTSLRPVPRSGRGSEVGEEDVVEEVVDGVRDSELEVLEPVELRVLLEVEVLELLLEVLALVELRVLLEVLALVELRVLLEVLALVELRGLELVEVLELRLVDDSGRSEVADVSDVSVGAGAGVGISGSSSPMAKYKPSATATTNMSAVAVTPMAMARVFVVVVPRLPEELMRSF